MYLHVEINIMVTESITIANLKCQGCENSIKKELLSIPGVESVTVNHEADSVTVVHDVQVLRDTLTSRLYKLGYPEATEENGLLLQLKSYASCMIGRLG